MYAITLHDPFDGRDFAAPVRVLTERAGATVGTVYLAEDALTVPVVIHDDGEVMCWSDWQAAPGDDEVMESLADGHWQADRWMRARDGERCIVLDGLPRVLE